MKEFIMYASVPKDWVWDDGEVHPEGGLHCFGKFDNYEKVQAKIAELKNEVEESGLPFEAKVYSREITDWRLEWPVVFKIDAGAQPDGAYVNGEWDWFGDKGQPRMPFLVPDVHFPEDWRWIVDVDVSTGRIKDWPTGIEAKTFFKSSDDVHIYYNGIDLNARRYVPKFLRPKESDEDYLAIEIDCHGAIKGWNAETVRKWIDMQLQSQTR